MRIFQVKTGLQNLMQYFSDCQKLFENMFRSKEEVNGKNENDGR